MGKLYKILYPVVTVLGWIFMKIVDTIFAYVYRNEHKTVSEVKDPILLQPAIVLANKIRSREYRVEEVMTSFIARAKEVNIVVNAIVGEQYDKALRAAQELDQVLDALSPEQIEKDYGPDKKPFLGVPLSVKEAFSWAGMSNTSGVVSRKTLRSKENALVLARLMEGGAIPFVQSNISECCMWFESSNYVYGCSNNAYNSSRMVGGSSGGEGCIVSTGASVLGIGSDIGGSIRMPCFFNGIFGHKCSPGIIDNTGQWPLASPKAMPLLSTGPMCRYAADLIPAFKQMAGPESCAKLQLDCKVDLSKLRVINVPDDGGSLLLSNVDPQLKSIQKKAADYLQQQGATVSEKIFPKFRLAMDMWAGRMNLADDGPKFSSIMSGLEDGSKVNCVKELFLCALRMSEHTLPAIMLGLITDYMPQHTRSADERAVQVLDKLRGELIKLLGDDGVLLYPSHPKLAPYHNHPLATPFNFAYTCLFNALSFPVTQCPLGLSKEGLPLGIQVVAAPFNDHLTLAVASALEKGFGGWVSPGTHSQK